MRSDFLALALLGIGAVKLAAAADPAPQPERAAAPAATVTDSASPATSAATTTPAPPVTSAPAATQSPAPKAVPPALSADEQRLLNQGYKPQMRNGEKIYCRREAELGSRIAAAQHCGTVAQLTTATQSGKDYLQKAQQTQASPMGN